MSSYVLMFTVMTRHL